MSLDKFKHGREFICSWREEGKFNVRICKYDEESELFFQQDKDGHFVIVPDEKRLFSFTKCDDGDCVFEFGRVE